MTNFDIARETLDTATNGSEGSAERELSNYQKGLQYSLDKFQAQFQDISNSFLDSGFLKGGVEIGTGLLSFLDGTIDRLGTLGTLGGALGIFQGIRGGGKSFA